MEQPSQRPEYYEHISKATLFSDLPENEYAHLVNTVRMLELPVGTVLFREGESGGDFYLILDGEIEIVKALGTPDEWRITTRHAGEYLGEMSVLNPNGKRTAAARSAGLTHLIEIKRRSLQDLIQRYPKIAYRLLQEVSQRLSTSNNQAVLALQSKNQELLEAFHRLQNAQAHILQIERLESEIRVARTIQESILPGSMPLAPGYQFSALIEPARMVGGDFYDLFWLDQNHLAVMIGDVSDKGVGAAIFMAQTHALLKTEARRGSSPAETFERANDLLLEMNANGQFVTAIYGVLDIQERNFVYARAGHELPFLINPQGVSRVRNQHGMALGVSGDLMLNEHRLELHAGETLVLYTDGVTDGLAGSSTESGAGFLKTLLQGYSHLDAPGLCQAIFTAVKANQIDGALFDDLTFVAIQVL